MPNWCQNDLEINGPKKDIDDLLEKSKGEESEFTMQGLVPCPQQLIDQVEDHFTQEENESDDDFKKRIEMINKRQYGARDWYYWRIANWGTKWDVSVDEVTRDDDEYAFMWFDSAWSPPIEYISRISKIYPQLRFKLSFMETGSDFQGHVIFSNGELTDEESHEVWYYKAFTQEHEEIPQDWLNECDSYDARDVAEEYLKNNLEVSYATIEYNGNIITTVTRSDTNPSISSSKRDDFEL